MTIRVTDVEINDVIFEGDAEDFLFENECDEDLESALNELDDNNNNKQSVTYYGNQYMEYFIEKINTKWEE